MAAVAYAADPRRRLARWVPVVGGLAVVALLAASVWAIATTGLAAPPTGADATSLGNLSVVTRATLGSVVLFVGLGLLGDARPAAARARRSLAITRPTPHTPSERAAYAMAWLRAFIDESAPGRTRAHRAALSERSRIARDLHADVVPALRRALAEAERDGSVEKLAASLREVLHEVDALVGSEHAIQLEFGGIVPALEWLAERVEERSTVRVTMNVEDWPDGRASQPPTEVAAAAFRVAGLALDNVIRHAPGSQATVHVRVGQDRVRLVIADDGPGTAGGDRTYGRQCRASRLGRHGLRGFRVRCLAPRGSRRWFGRRVWHDSDIRLARRAGGVPLREDPQRRCGRDPDSGHRSSAAMLGQLTHPGQPASCRRQAHLEIRWNVSETDCANGL